MEELVVPEKAAEVTSLSWVQLQLLAARLVAEIPPGDAVNAVTAKGGASVVVDGGTDLGT